MSEADHEQPIERSLPLTERPLPLSQIAEKYCELSSVTLSSHRWDTDFPAVVSGDGTSSRPHLYHPGAVVAWERRHMERHPMAKVMSDRTKGVSKKNKRADGAGASGRAGKGSGKGFGSSAPDFTDPAKALKRLIANYEREITRLQGDIDRYDERIKRAKLALDALQEGEK